ncbi:MAG: hypothetical protein Q7K45_03890 [Nanoarchaeota archaeon]|nr:hypothetical protein [Nanoarchaeota archaeon]
MQKGIVVPFAHSGMLKGEAFGTPVGKLSHSVNYPELCPAALLRLGFFTIFSILEHIGI